MKRFLLSLLLLTAFAPLRAQITLDECVRLAEENYPLIKRYDLVSKMSELNLSDVNKSWLPQINVYGQATIQNLVPSFPETLTGILDKLGTQMDGLNRFQYKVGVDLTQTVWDGGVSKARREIVKAEYEVNKAELGSKMYEIRKQVENLYFASLLTDAQIRQIELSAQLLENNRDRLEAMLVNGVAMQSDVDMLEARLLEVRQNLVSARSAHGNYLDLLSLFIGKRIGDQSLEVPSADIPRSKECMRPELQAIDARIRANSLSLKSIKADIMPKIGFFAQAYYGYPGFDYFKSMSDCNPSFNVIGGLKISWNVGALYTRSNRIDKLRLSSLNAENDRDIFMFNNKLERETSNSRIDELDNIMADDSRIVELRRNVRKAAEAQLENGVIDATALLDKITAESQASLTQAYHNIQRIQYIYQLKYTLNQ